MQFGLKLAPQNTTLADLRSVWRIADEAGFDHTWTYDHLASIGDSPDGDVYDGWTLLAVMAEVTSRVRIGCMVTGNTYRHPAVLAKIATTVDHLSNGRLEFGLGASWQEFEHASLGLELGAPGPRLDRLEEACEVIRALWTEDRISFSGTHYRLDGAVHEPKPVQKPYPPIWIGGSGRKRTLRIAARFADVWNSVNESPESFEELSGVLDRHCDDVGRDPRAIRRTIQVFVEDASQARAAVDGFRDAGADDIIFTVKDAAPGQAVATAERLAALLPELRG